ncbi:MAG: amino acid adenylation domain-containing protein, partial [Cyanobacteria bacterium P01_F01_bin.116]
MNTKLSRNIQTIYPATPMQQGMLFHSAYAAESGIYVEQLQFTLEGAVELDKLRQAWQQLIDQHDVLRTCFVWQRIQTLQVVLKQVELPWHQHDWQHIPEEQQPQKLQEWLQQDQQSGFETTKAPLMRCTLITLANHRHQFVWTYHHALLDGWSLSILMQDLLAHYEANGQPNRRRPYQNYVAWLQKQSRETVEDYWRQQLAGLVATTPLPLQVQENTPSLVSDLHEWTHLLSAQLTEKIQAWARQRRMSLATLIYGVWGILLSRYSGESDVVFGITVSGRDIPLNGIEDMVGLFINTLPLRMTLSSGCSGETVLKQLQQDLQDLQRYSYMPLVEIQRLSGQPQDLFNTLVVIENYPIDQALRDYQQTLPIQNVIASERTNYPLTLVMLPGKQLSLNFAYNKNLFTVDTIERLGQHFEILLQAIINDSSATIATLPMVTDAEQQLLTKWNHTAEDYAQETCIHQLFEQQVDKTPDATAVILGDTQLTYQDLNQRANQLAHHLQGLGVGPDTLVGICVERSSEMVVGLLATLKAGGAYVPIDPYYPEARIQFMLQDTQVSVLLTQTHLLASLPESNAQLICLDAAWPTVAQNSSENLSTSARSDHLAYVIFTSGSTGQPKGVMVPHRAISNQMQWIQQAFSLDTTDRFLQRTNVSFDASVWEFYAPLLAGAQLVLAQPGRLLDGDALVKTIIDQKITHLQLVPSLLRLLLEQPDFHQCQSLKRVFCGGEALSVDVSQAFFSQLDSSLHNLYGPTEACINSTYWTCQTGEIPKNIPIGRPIANAQAYILDENLQLVPMGAPGELHMGGAGLAKGYLNRPELTAEKFIANPFGEGCLYKTGDLVRYQSDGTIEYLGRIDHQVKVRGFRIELGEIEAALTQQQQVKAGVVLVREDEPGDQRLVAYVVGSEISEEALKTSLKQCLPDYMVPTVIVPLDKMPLTPNGKVDRKALPAPAVSKTESFVAPQTERQTLIANLFAEILSIPAEAIGIHDDFFELGGHSLLAMRLITSLRQAFEKEIPLKVLFETPTVAGVDAALDAQNIEQLSIPNVTPTPRDEKPIPLSYAQERLWFLAQLEGVSATYNMPGAVRVEGSFDVALLQRALRDMIRRHEVLRTTFPVVNGAAVQRIHPTLEIPLRVIESSELTMPLPDWLNHEVQQPFSLSTGPLLRLALVRLKSDTAVLVLTMHHMISDGWSIGVFIRELIALYGTYGKDKPALPTLPVQYADYAQWQRQWLQGEVLETQLGYWRQQLADAPTLLELPTDHPRPAVQSFNGRTQVITLPKLLGDQVEALSKQHQVTLFMTLLTAFQILLYRYSNQPDIVVGSSIANRQQTELEPLIGLFVNTLVLRSHIHPTDSVKSLLHQVKQMTLEAYSHKDVPFEQVVETLQPQRSLAHSPLFQVMFMLQNIPRTPLELPNMTVTPLTAESVAAKFDLTLSVEESDQGLVGQWEYNTDLFEPETIARMANHFEVLLTAMVADVSQSVATLPLLTSTEKQQLVEWNATAAPYPDDCLHILIEHQAKRTPDAVAVVFETDQLTYQDLNTKAESLAHQLQSMGVGPDTLVGICVERSVDMMVGLLAILK